MKNHRLFALLIVATMLQLGCGGKHSASTPQLPFLYSFNTDQPTRLLTVPTRGTVYVNGAQTDEGWTQIRKYTDSGRTLAKDNIDLHNANGETGRLLFASSNGKLYARTATPTGDGQFLSSISVFDGNEQPLSSFTRNEATFDNFIVLSLIVTATNQVYVDNSFNGGLLSREIVHFDASGNEVGSFSTEYTTRYPGPTALATDKVGNVYVAQGDYRLGRSKQEAVVRIYSPTGTLLGETRTGRLCNGGITAMAIDSQGNVYLAGMKEGGIVQKFDRSGRLLATIDLSSPTYHCTLLALDDSGKLYVGLDDGANGVFVYKTTP